MRPSTARPRRAIRTRTCSDASSRNGLCPSSALTIPLKVASSGQPEAAEYSRLTLIDSARACSGGRPNHERHAAKPAIRPMPLVRRTSCLPVICESQTLPSLGIAEHCAGIGSRRPQPHGVLRQYVRHSKASVPAVPHALRRGDLAETVEHARRPASGRVRTHGGCRRHELAEEERSRPQGRSGRHLRVLRDRGLFSEVLASRPQMAPGLARPAPDGRPA